MYTTYIILRARATQLLRMPLHDYFNLTEKASERPEASRQRCTYPQPSVASLREVTYPRSLRRPRRGREHLVRDARNTSRAKRAWG